MSEDKASESDIEAAAERLIANGWDYANCPDQWGECNDARVLAQAYLARLAADRAERDRDKSIRESVMDMVDICLSGDADEQERDMAASTILEAVRPSMLAELANRSDRAEREERARPIDAEWLESIGFVDEGLYAAKGVGRMKLLWHRTTGRARFGGFLLGAFKTRGDLGDLLRVLKGGAE